MYIAWYYGPLLDRMCDDSQSRRCQLHIVEILGHIPGMSWLASRRCDPRIGSNPRDVKLTSRGLWISSPRCWGQHKPNGMFWASVTPLYLEDENNLQKSASMVVIQMHFHLSPRRPIFDSPQNKNVFSPMKLSNRSVGAGKLFEQPGFMKSLYRTGDFEISITVSKI